MPFAARTAALIRDTILANRAARYRALGKELSIVQDSDAYIEADVNSLEQELLEQQALKQTLEYFPDTASDATAIRHATLIGLTRKPATGSVLSVLMTGTPSQSSPATGKTLNAADGTKYTPNVSGNIVLDGSGHATLEFTATTVGAATNKAPGTILTWSSAPTGVNSTGTVTAIASTGADIETISALVSRVLRWWKERPGSGNRADVVDWAESVPAIDRAFVYPVTHSSLGPGTLGAIKVLLLGAAAARTPASPFGIGSDDIQHVLDLFLGTGSHASDGGKISADVDPDDVSAVVPTPQAVDVTASVVLSSQYSFPFAGSFTTYLGSTQSELLLSSDPTGTVAQGDTIAIQVDGDARGGRLVRTVTNVGSFSLTIDPPLPNAPTVSKSIIPAPANYQAIVDAIVALFDRLGPGDVDLMTFPHSGRWPTTLDSNPSTLYKAAITAVIMGVPGMTSAPIGVHGVVSTTVSAPASDQVADPFVQFVPGLITITA